MDDTPRQPNYLLPILLIVALLVLLYAFNTIQRSQSPGDNTPVANEPTTGSLTDAQFTIDDSPEYQPIFFAEPNLQLLPDEYPLRANQSAGVAFLEEQAITLDADEASYVLTVRDDPLQLELDTGDTLATYLSSEERRMTRQMVIEVLPELQNYVASVQRAYDRPNPSEVAPELVQEELHSSIPTHPSSVSAELRLIELVMTELGSPEAQAIAQAIDEYDQTAEQAGLQFPADTKLGQTIADSYFSAIDSTPEFRLLREAALTEQ